MKNARKALLIGALTVTAIAGAVASAKRVSNTRYYWSNNNNTGTVHSIVVDDKCTTVGGGCRAEINDDGDTRQLFANPDGTGALKQP